MHTYILIWIVGFLCGRITGASTQNCRRNRSDICKENASIRHFPAGETFYFQLDGSWSLNLLKTSNHDAGDISKNIFGGQLKVRRVSKCEIEVFLDNVALGHQRLVQSERILVEVNRQEVKQICRERKQDGEKNRYIEALVLNAVSALVNIGVSRPLLHGEQRGVFEDDNFGSCLTHYKMKKTSDNESVITKTRNLKKCGKVHQEYHIESGKPSWIEKPLLDFTEKSVWKCIQSFKNERLNRVECFHNVTMTETSDFTSLLNLNFLKSEISNTPIESRIFYEYTTELESQDVEKELLEEFESLLKIACENSKNDISNDAVRSIPKIIATMNKLSDENIINLYKKTQSGLICSNVYFKNLFTSLMRDSISPAASTAKCKIMLEEGVMNVGWVSSLAYTMGPTTETLKACSGLLRQPSWRKSVLGVSSLAGTFSSAHCKSSSRDHESCHSGSDFQTISKSLWLKARNCGNSHQDYQDMALWSIQGLKNLDYIDHDIRDTLLFCLQSREVSVSVKIASFRVLAKRKCNYKLSLLLQEIILKDNKEAELRMEAFKTLFRCDKYLAQEIVKSVILGEIQIRSSQVNAYIESFSDSSNKTTSSIFKLSRHFDIDFSDLFDLPEKSVLFGDVIFDDSFLPRSLNLNFKSKILEEIADSVKIEVRQENLEEILQSIFGPEGIKGKLQTLLQEALFKYLNNFKNETHQNSNNETRHKRSFNALDFKTVLNEVKEKVIGNLKAAVSVGLGRNQLYFGTFSVNPFLNDLETTIDNFINSASQSVVAQLANFDMASGVSWARRSEEAVSWSFLGYSLKLRRHEGILGTVQMSSQVNLFSLMKSLFNPSIDITLNPNFGAYWHSSMQFGVGKHIVEAKLETPMRAGFDIKLSLKPQKHDQDILLDFPASSFHGYSVTTFRTLQTYNDDHDDHDVNLNSKEGGTLFMTKQKLLNDDLLSVCQDGVFESIGIKSCFKSMSWDDERSSVSHSEFLLTKSDPEIDRFKIRFSVDSPGEDTLFISVLSETEGNAKKKSGTLIVAFDYAPHPSFKLLLQGGQHSAVFETNIVNDNNLKRLEAHSKVGDVEYGLKAEVLMVRDGGQISIKPRLVVSRPSKREDSLIVGYMAHYSSDKVRSFTLDLVTDGSLKDVYDVAIKGTTEYRCQSSLECQINLKNVHFVSPELDLGLEVSLFAEEDDYGVNSQITLNNDVMMFNTELQNLYDVDKSGKRELNIQFLNPSRPQRDVKLSFVMNVCDQDVSNNLTVLHGSENSQWNFSVLHTTSWKFVYDNNLVNHGTKNIFSRIIQAGRGAEVSNFVHIQIPTSNWEWKLKHNFDASETSLENKVEVHHLKESYTIQTNLYDQSDQNFRYHMEIKVDFPALKFGYVDTVLERSTGDFMGESLTTMPSGSVYRSSSRFKYQNVIDSVCLEITHDTQAQDHHQPFRISFRNSFESTPSFVTLLLSLDTPEPLVTLQFSIEDLEARHADVIFNVLVHKVIKAELISRSTGSESEVQILLNLIPYSKEMKGKLMLKRHLSGGGTFDSEVGMVSMSVPSDFDPVVLKASSSLSIDDPGLYIVKSDVSVMGWDFATEMKAELGQEVGDPQKITIIVQLPERATYEGEAFFLFNYGAEKQTLETLAQIKLPSGILYRLSLSGKSVFVENSLAEAEFQTDIDSPFTQKIFLRTHAKNQLHEDNVRDFIFYCKTHSEANYWKKLQVDFKCKLQEDSVKTVFVAEFGQKRVILESLGYLQMSEKSNKAKAVAEIKLPFGGGVEQLKVFVEGELVTTSHPPGIKMSQRMLLQKNYIEIFNTTGDLLLNIPKTEGVLIINHRGNIFKRQKYEMEGTFSGQELDVVIHGMVDNIPVRSNIQYVDGKLFKVFASYGGSSYASIELTTRLEGFSLKLKEISDSESKLSSSGKITFKRRLTTFQHVLIISQERSSTSLRINAIRGKPVKLYLSRLKHALNEWKTTAKLEWGPVKFNYQDEIIFKGLKDFNVKSFLDVPAFNLRDLHFHLISSHQDYADQTFSLKYTKERVVVHSGRFSIETSPLNNKTPFKIHAELVDIIINGQEIADVKFKQYLVLPEQGIELKSVLKRGDTSLAEVVLTGLDDRRQMVFSVCSNDRKCVRFKVNVQSFSQTSLARNFGAEIKFLNSLLWKNTHDDIIEHTVALSAENRNEEVILSGKIARGLCVDILCGDVSISDKHAIHLAVSPKKLDCEYETQNRTLLLKTSLTKGINKKLDENDSALIKIQLWFDRTHKPEDVITWITTYQISSLNVKVEEYVESIITHPHIEKPIEITGKFSSLSDFRREALIDFNIFKEPQKAFQLYFVKDVENGEHKLKANLKRVEELYPHVSLASTIVPVFDSGYFDLVIEAPLKSVEQNDSQKFYFKYRCDIEGDMHNVDFKCAMDSVTLAEKFGLSFANAPSTCAGFGASSYIFEKTYKAYGIKCHDPLHIATVLSVTNNSAEDLSLRIGLEDSNQFKINVLDIMKSSLRLCAPFLLKGSFNHRSLYQRLADIESLLENEWISLVGHSRDLSRKMMIDGRKFFHILQEFEESSLIEELSDIIVTDTSNALEELRNDELLRDISQTIESTYNMTSIIFEFGIAFIEMATGRRISYDYLSKYYSSVSKVSVDSTLELYSHVLQEINYLSDYFNNLAMELAQWVYILKEYVIDESVFSDAIKWIYYRIKSTVNMNSWQSVFANFSKLIQKIGKIVSYFYPDANSDSNDEYALFIPLYENSYNLRDFFSRFGGTDSKRYSTVTLPEEIQRWIHLILRPEIFAETVLPPYEGQGIIMRNSLITFDGKLHNFDTSCPKLLLGIYGQKQTRIRLFSRASEDEVSGENNQEYLFIIGKDSLRLTSDRNVISGDSAVLLPYSKDLITVTRKLNSINLSLKDKDGTKLLDFICLLDRDLCVVDLGGWLFSDTFGLLGSFDRNPYNDYEMLNGSVTTNARLWESSWTVNSDCLTESQRVNQRQMKIEERYRNICSAFLLRKDSSVVPCHNYVNIDAYHEMCIKTLQTLHYNPKSFQNLSRAEKMRDKQKLNATNAFNSQYKNMNNVKNEIKLSKRRRRRILPETLYLEGHFDFLDATIKEKRVLCDVIAAYEVVCAQSNVMLKSPEECDKEISEDILDLNESKLDLVIFKEEIDCTGDHKSLFSSLPDDLQKELLTKKINLSVGRIGYGASIDGTPTFYSLGSTLLLPVEQFVISNFSEKYAGQGSLNDAFKIIKRFPFRKGSIRIVFVDSCIDEDLPEFSSALVQELRARRIIVFSLTNNLSSLKNHKKSNAMKGVIGVDSEFVYQLKESAVAKRRKPNLVLPSSNMAHVSLQTGGGVFSITEMRGEKMTSSHRVKQFRKIFVRALQRSAENLRQKMNKSHN